VAEVLVLGAGHNGLVCACYLAQAGHRVTVLERGPEIGGATRSREPFAGVPARLSVYSYLVSLLPERIISDLGLDFTLAPRAFSSYTPDPDAPERGLLLPAEPIPAAQAVEEFTGRSADARGYLAFLSMCQRFAWAVFDTLTEPLPSAADLRSRVADEPTWQAFTTRPLGETLTGLITDDLVRGVLLTDGLIGTFARSDSLTLAQNRCLVAHVIGRRTGAWLVPIGGMGALVDALAQRAASLGVQVLTEAEVITVDVDATGAGVTCRMAGTERRFTADAIASSLPEPTLRDLLGEPTRSLDDAQAGAQVKVNLVLSRLPRLRDPATSAAAAFSGTFHCHETMSGLDRAYDRALAGDIPAPLPIEAYCHSLTDPTILAPSLREAGVHTLTLFGLHTPHRLAQSDPERFRADIRSAALDSLASVLAEPLEECLLPDAHGEGCLEVTTTVDLAAELGLPGGNIFHTPLGWPFAPTSDAGDPDAGRVERPTLVSGQPGTWGVATDLPRLVVCGSSARRGGAVSGIPGHNAARHLIELLG